MAFTDSEIRERMEPEVNGMPLALASEASLAISMKRIADFICGSSSNSDVVDYLAKVMGGIR